MVVSAQLSGMMKVYLLATILGLEGRKEWVYHPDEDEKEDVKDYLSDSDDEDSTPRQAHKQGATININFNDLDSDGECESAPLNNEKASEACTKKKEKLKKSSKLPSSCPPTNSSTRSRLPRIKPSCWQYLGPSLPLLF
jgi:hypothetical protein